MKELGLKKNERSKGKTRFWRKEGIKRKLGRDSTLEFTAAAKYQVKDEKLFILGLILLWGEESS